MSISTIVNIRNIIGDRANYLYAIIFSEACGDVIGFVYLIIGFFHYALVEKKLEISTKKHKK